MVVYFSTSFIYRYPVSNAQELTIGRPYFIRSIHMFFTTFNNYPSRSYGRGYDT